MSAVPALAAAERAAGADPAGLLVLHHGRGSDERALLGLGEAVDPEHRLHVAAPRAPLPLGTGFEWFRPRAIGFPEPDSFRAGAAALAAFHDRLWLATGIPPERTVLAGFSMGAAVAYGLGLAAARPAPAGIVAIAGGIPSVEGYALDLPGRAGLPVFIAHGRRDRLVEIAHGRSARGALEAAGLRVSWHESRARHEIDGAWPVSLRDWLAEVLGL